MKKSRFFKVLAPIIALGLLICAFVGINAQAADGDNGAPEIISMNVEYGSELYLYYAVDKASVAGAPSLEIVNADGTEILETITSYNTEDVWGISCYVFKTNGVAPGKLNQAEYVRACGENGKGEIVKYSVEDYLYTRLYQNGFAAKTAEDPDGYNRRALYFQLLEYGKSAQKIFYPDSTDIIGNPGIAIKGNFDASGEYDIGACIVLDASGIDGFDYWSVTEMTPFGKVLGERKLGAGYEYLVVKSAVIIPVTDDDAAEDVEKCDPNVVTFNTVNPAFVGTSNDWGVGERVFDAEEGNWYHKITKKAGTGGGSFYIYATGGDVATATEIVVEFDFFAGGDLSRNWQFHLPASTTKSTAYAYSPFIDTHLGSFNAVVANKWNHIKIVYSVAEDGSDFSVKVYVNNMANPAKTFSTASYASNANKVYGSKLSGIPSIAQIDRFEFNFNGSASGEYKVDNASFIYR